MRTRWVGELLAKQIWVNERESNVNDLKIGFDKVGGEAISKRACLALDPLRAQGPKCSLIPGRLV